MVNFEEKWTTPRKYMEIYDGEGKLLKESINILKNGK